MQYRRCVNASRFEQTYSRRTEEEHPRTAYCDAYTTRCRVPTVSFSHHTGIVLVLIALLQQLLQQQQSYTACCVCVCGKCGGSSCFLPAGVASATSAWSLVGRSAHSIARSLLQVCPSSWFVVAPPRPSSRQPRLLCLCVLLLLFTHRYHVYCQLRFVGAHLGGGIPIQDHDNAALLANGLAALPGIDAERSPGATNAVYFQASRGRALSLKFESFAVRSVPLHGRGSSSCHHGRTKK